METSSGETGKLLDFSDRSNQKKYYGTTSANREAVSISIAQLYIDININKKKKSTIINFGATENFIIKKYIKNKKYLTWDKK